MEAPMVTLSQPQKRPFEDDAAVMAVSTPPNRPPSERSSTPLTDLSGVPTPSPFKNASAPASSNNSVAGDASAALSTIIVPKQPTKKRKLTLEEKEAQRLEDEAKKRERAQKKAEREEADRMKALKKAERDQERAKKKAEQDQKKADKEQKQAEKLEAERKKERSQLRLVSFFGKAKAGDDSGNATVVATTQTTPAPTVSLQPAAVCNADSGSPSPQKAIQKNANSDYERYFLPFQPPSHALLAPYNQYMEDPVALATARSRLDEIATGGENLMDLDQPEHLKSGFTSRGPRGIPTMSIAEIVERMNGSLDKPIDLTSDARSGSEAPLELLNAIPMKYLRFPEDVRPAYYGTYTKKHSRREEAKLARNPFSRVLHETDYDYDSEAEWEEPEEGEDLDLDSEDDDAEPEDDGDDEELEGFLDDGDDPQLKRKLISSDLQPVSTGLCWQGADGVSRLNDGSGAICTEFKDFQMGFLLEPYPPSIDPFSTAYWTPEPSTAANATAGKDKGLQSTNGAMQPPRFPLSSRPINGLLNTLNSKAESSTSKAVKPAKRMVPPEHMDAFKAAINGSDMTKLAIIEHLKKEFPSVTKDAIAHTLPVVAQRVGGKQAEKRWVLL